MFHELVAAARWQQLLSTGGPSATDWASPRDQLAPFALRIGASGHTNRLRHPTGRISTAVFGGTRLGAWALLRPKRNHVPILPAVDPMSSHDSRTVWFVSGLHCVAGLSNILMRDLLGSVWPVISP